jgi:thiamine biosynthesis lipoprotein
MMAERPDDALIAPGPALLIPPDVPLQARPDHGRALHHRGEIFGTGWSLALMRRADTDPVNDEAYRAQLVKACEQTLALIDEQMSHWRERSAINRYNQAQAGEVIDLPRPMADVVALALELSQRTQGAYHPGLYDAVEQCGFGSRPMADPVASGLAHARNRAMPMPGCPSLRGSSLEKRCGFSLDLNGIAKGYAVDLLCDVIRAHPDTDACLVEIGGELKGYGTREDGMPFWTDLAPRGDPRFPSYRAALYGWACATSGEAERCHQGPDRTYSHILDPRTGMSVDTDIVAASVFHKQCATADALATALVVMGGQDARAFAERHSIACVLTPRRSSEGCGGDWLSEAMRGWL